MSDRSLEERVERLERKVANLYERQRGGAETSADVGARVDNIVARLKSHLLIDLEPKEGGEA